MATKPDLNKLKTEIDTRKREKGMITENSQGTTVMPRDVFLNTLLTSLQTGKNTPVINNIKTMAARADIVSGAIKTGVVTTEAIKKINELKNSGVVPASYNAPVQHQTSRQPVNEAVDMSPERDDNMYGDLERKRRNVTLAESIKEFQETPVVGSPMLNQPPTHAMPLNEVYLSESVKKIVNNYLIENFGPVVEEAIKSTILEMYAVERIKEVLQENKEMIKSLVYETIREIQAKSKKKGQ
jgi:hypothetical protein